MKDVIRLKGMSFYGYHGVTSAEKEIGRRYEVDCELEADLSKPGQTDQLADTVDYAQAFNLIKDTVEGTAYSLLEALAAAVAAKLLDAFEIYRVTLKVRKMSPPIEGEVDAAEVEITRYQSDPTKLLNGSD